VGRDGEGGKGETCFMISRGIDVPVVNVLVRLIMLSTARSVSSLFQRILLELLLKHGKRAFYPAGGLTAGGF